MSEGQSLLYRSVAPEKKTVMGEKYYNHNQKKDENHK